MSLEIADWLSAGLTAGWLPGRFIADKVVGLPGSFLKAVGQSFIFISGLAIVCLYSQSLSVEGRQPFWHQEVGLL